MTFYVRFHRNVPCLPDCLPVILKVTLRANPSLDAEDMRRTDLGIEFHIVPGAVPQITCVVQKVVHLVRLLWVVAQLGKRKLYPARLCVAVVQVHHDQNNIGKVLCMLAIANELLIA